MEAVIIALGLVVVFQMLALLVLAFRVTGGPSLANKTVVVHTRQPDDRTIRGVLHGAYSDRWTLREAVLLAPGGVEQDLGGLQHIPTEMIAWAQEIEAKL